eukprot:4998873-Karenia_brevis.AAC.1
MAKREVPQQDSRNEVWYSNAAADADNSWPDFSDYQQLLIVQLPIVDSPPVLEQSNYMWSETKSLPTSNLCSRFSSVQSHRGEGAFEGEKGKGSGKCQ